MWLYLIIFFIPVLVYFLFDRKLCHSVKFLAIIMALLALFVGIGDMLGGYDRYIYGQLFDMLADDVRKGWNPADAFIFEQYKGEWGYTWLNVLIAQFTANRYIFILILTLIIYSLLFVSFKRYMEDYPFAMILFMALWFFFTFTYLRQVLAASIGYLSIKYIIKRNPWKFALVMALAYFMHNSAIILVPFYLLPAKKFSVWSILTVMVICFVVGASGATVGLYSTYGDVANAQIRVAKYDVEGSFRIAYFLEAVFFLFFIFRSYDKIDANDRKHVVLMNMAFGFCAILLFFIRSENGGRLSWFYMIGVIATMTYLFSGKKRINDMSITLVIVSLFLYIRILSYWGISLYPYKTFFSNGIRENDFIEEIYEYDHNYDVDKFYR
jgi:hypothetical protein